MRLFVLLALSLIPRSGHALLPVGSLSPRSTTRRMASPSPAEAARTVRIVSCFCGACTLAVTGPPSHGVSYCHCSICRRLSGAAFSTQALWSASDVEVKAGQELHRGMHATKNVERIRCGECGAPVMARLMKGKVNALPLSLFDRELLTTDPGFAAQHHLHYASRIVDVDDGLPKFEGGSRGPLWTPSVVIAAVVKGSVAPSCNYAGEMTEVPPVQSPMPPPLLSDVPGTWAYDTMSRRVVEEILDKPVMGDNADALSAGGVLEFAKPKLDALRAEILAAAPLTPLPEDGGDDVEAWNALLADTVAAGDTWLSAPWLLAEFYLYRRVAAATGYFDSSTSGSGYDVFAKAKTAGLKSAAPSLEALATRLLPAIADPSASTLFVSISLWGNRMDLSLWPADAGVASSADAFNQVLASSNEQLLADDTEDVLALLDGLRSTTGEGDEVIIDLVVDNAGFELCTDLLLADHLLSSGCADVVQMRVKHHPTFVSDALEQDVRQHAETLAAGDDAGAAALASRWKGHLDSGRIRCVADAYWAMPYPMWAQPASLRSDLKQNSALVVVKGDANYRRMLGDRPWPFDAPFTSVASYFPTNVLCLRTLKAELGCGMAPAKTDAAAAADDTWLVDGKWGVIQLAPPAAE